MPKASACQDGLKLNAMRVIAATSVLDHDSEIAEAAEVAGADQHQHHAVL